MGGIKTTFIKNISRLLIEKYPKKFGKDFETNKAVLQELKLVDSKLNRNKIASSIAKLRKREAKE